MRATRRAFPSRQYACNFTVIRGIFSIAKIFWEATAPERYALEIKAIVAEKFKVEVRVDQQKNCAFGQNTHFGAPFIVYRFSP